MLRPSMSKIPVWSVRSHLVLRAPVLIPVSLGPKNFGHWQNFHQNPSQWSFTCSSDQICRKYYSWFRPPCYKKICQSNLGKVPGVTRTDEGRLWKIDVAALTTSTVETLELLDGVKVKYSIAHKAVKDEHYHNVLSKQEHYQKYFLTEIEGEKLYQYYSEMISAKKVLSNFHEFLTEYFILHEKEPHRQPTETEKIHFHYLFAALLNELEIHEIWCLTRHFLDIAKKHETTRLFKQYAWVVSKVILKRIGTLSSEEIFKTADMLFLVGMYRSNLLMKGLVQRMMNQETTEHQVLFFFYMGLEGVSAAGVTEKLWDEDQLMRLFENLDIDEVGVICYGLFKARVRLQDDKLALLLLEKFEGNLDLCPDVAAVSIFRFLMYTFDRRLSEKFPNIYKRLTNKHFTEKLASFVSHVKMEDFRQSSVYYILRIYSTIHFTPEVLKNAIAKKIIQDKSGQLRNMRLKDLSELITRYVLFSSDDKTSRHLFKLIKEEAVKRLTWHEVEIYRQPFIALIDALCQKEIYAPKLIQRLFGTIDRPLYPEGKIDDGDNVKGLIYSISESIKIERPQYHGPLTEKSFADAVPKMAWYQRQLRHILVVGKIKQPTLRNQFTSDAEEALECYFGDRKYLKTQMFLPHFLKFDIGFAVNEMGDVIPSCMWVTKEGKIRQEETIKRIAIVLEMERDGMITCMDKDGNLSKMPSSRVIMKFRQMKLLGFEVVPIFYEEFESCENKQELLEKKLSPYVRKSSKKIGASS